jgi:pre-mRNA-processing factor 17
MEQLAAYDEDAASLPKLSADAPLMKKDVILAPNILTREEVRPLIISPYASEIAFNPKAESIFTPVLGPVDPHARNGGKIMNSLTGHIETVAVSDASFADQYHTFHQRHYAADPSGSGVVGNLEQYQKFGGDSVLDTRSEKGRVQKMKRRNAGDPAGDYLGPWAPFETGTMPLYKFPEYQDKDGKTEAEGGGAVEAEAVPEPEAEKGGKVKGKKKEEEKKTEEAAEPEKSADGKTVEGVPPKKKFRTDDDEAEEEAMRSINTSERSILHIENTRDYLGRSFMVPPSDLKVRPHDCFLPKKHIHTWLGHTKGVSQIRFMPGPGHLLLSAGLDNKVILWDVYNHNRSAVRTYLGHNKGVKDICFNNDGTRFLSAGYDRMVRLWDTETGVCINRFTTGKIPFCCKFNPHPDHNDEFLVGQQDKKIIQWDIKTGKQTQDYDQHLGAVNSITFLDNNRRFVSSSDDKTLRIWEYGIPVVIKYIAEPHMHSMPIIRMHPDNSCFVAQSMDNQILVYGAGDKFKLNRKKRFAGHLNAGFACGVGVSVDGKYVTSGDASGQLWIWDWKTCRVLKTIKAHDGVLTNCEWHPVEPSRVATCGWDGKINYWD